MNSNLSAGRLTAIIAGGALVSLATLVLLASAALGWAGGEKDADGYYTTSTERFSTGTYALATENLDIDDGVPLNSGHYGNVRLKVHSNDGQPLFVGVARTADVDRYLRDSAHATLTDFDVDPFSAQYRTSGADQRPAAPATQDIWAASTQGDGTQKLTWDVEDGDWSVVVMNADGSKGVDAGISAGADLPFLDDLATGSLIFGLLLLIGGGATMAGGLIRPRKRQSVLAGSASAA